MNIWQTLVIKIGHAAAAVLLFVGISAPSTTPPVTIIHVHQNGQVSEHAASTSTQPSIKHFVKPAPAEPTSTPAQTPVPIFIIQSPTPMTDNVPTPTPAEATPAEAAAAAPMLTDTPVSQASLEIFSPIDNKGLDRTYNAATTTQDDSNYIELGLIVRDADGKPVNNVEVVITATDETQNKTLEATGSVTNIYIEGQKTLVPYYSFHYDFKTTGDHFITFAAEGLIQSVILTVN